jgi:hypothetical protein
VFYKALHYTPAKEVEKRMGSDRVKRRRGGRRRREKTMSTCRPSLPIDYNHG